MKTTIALVGNPNSGKTTLFNCLTGSNQFVGNWPGVTVERKEGKLKGKDDVTVVDLPGVYSLSPYTNEEVIARDYLLSGAPDIILNIIDGTNMERNLYLTSQLKELGVPMIVAVNMADEMAKTGDTVVVKELGNRLGCKVISISALKKTGLDELITALTASDSLMPPQVHSYSPYLEEKLKEIEEKICDYCPKEQVRWYAIKAMEHDEDAISSLMLVEKERAFIDNAVKLIENSRDDDIESIIAGARYDYIATLVQGIHKKAPKEKQSLSDKIDRIVTNRYLAFPIFVVVMFLVYFVSVTTVGAVVTSWANDGVFGEGWHFLYIGAREYEEALDAYAKEKLFTPALMGVLSDAVNGKVNGADKMLSAAKDGSYGDFSETYKVYKDELKEKGYDIENIYESAFGDEAEGVPQPSEYGLWIDGLPTLAENALEKLAIAPWLISLIVEGIIGGVGAVLGFLPQMIILFALLAFLEGCGYMARIAFVMDRLFRRFGLSGKSFIPMLVASGCGIPGIMASRTIESERDRRMTIITATFIPCGAKLPIIALITASLFKGAWWVGPSAYFMGVGAVILSGIILKKTRVFSSDAAPFIMELPEYRLPSLSNLIHTIWEKAWMFIKKAGTIILVASVAIWFGSKFGFEGGRLAFNVDMALEESLLGSLALGIQWIFAPLGFGNVKATVATIMGLVAKEEVVGVFGVVDFANMTQLSAYAFLAFNLLCAPCFAAIGAIRKEMNSFKWTAFAVGYQCVFAYCVALVIYQFGNAFGGNINPVGLVAAVGVVAFGGYMALRPQSKRAVKERTV